MFAVADCGSLEYSISSSQHAVIRTHQIQSNAPGRSYTPSSSLDVRETEAGAPDMIQKVDRGRAYEGVRSSSSFSGLELPLKPSNANYHSPVFTRNDSILQSSSHRLTSEPDSWFRGSSTPRAAASDNSNLRGARSSRDFLTDLRGSVSAVARSRSRSSISKHGGPPLRHNSVSSVSDDASQYRRLRCLEAGSSADFLTDRCGGSFQSRPRSRSRSPVSVYGEPSSLLYSSTSSVPGDVSRRRIRCPEAGSSRSFSTDHHRPHVLPMPSSSCLSPDSKFGEQLSLRPSSVSDVGDNEQYLRSYNTAAEQSASSRKRQHHHQQQQPHHQPLRRSSSLLFTKKLAKLRELRYAKSQRHLFCLTSIIVFGEVESLGMSHPSSREFCLAPRLAS